MNLQPLRFTIFTLLLFSFTFFEPSNAQESDPNVAAYERAESMLSWNLNSKIYNHNVNPVQIDDDHFWYMLNSREGDLYYLVDVSNRQITIRNEFNGYTSHTLPIRIADSYQIVTLTMKHITNQDNHDDQ